ncbi:MFS transporter, partial [Candidatus Bathyarchaeota archaeon]|nr:MFS transporter [Candidatus Bathyarchaeota archaeon]
MTRMKRKVSKMSENETKSSRRSARAERHHAFLGKYNINPRVAMLTLSLSVFVDMLGYTMVLPLLPQIAKSFGAQDIILGIIIASNSFASLIFGPIWGKISDNKGRRPILLISQVGTMGAFIMLGLSQNLIMIFCARLLDGVFGGQMPIIRAYITDITTPETRSSEIAKIQGASAFCLIIGPVVGGVLGAIDWRIPSF